VQTATASFFFPPVCQAATPEILSSNLASIFCSQQNFFYSGIGGCLMISKAFIYQQHQGERETLKNDEKNQLKSQNSQNEEKIAILSAAGLQNLALKNLSY
jgi:hypothetical protein